LTNLGYQGDLSDCAALSECLAAAGLAADACPEKAALFATAVAALPDADPRPRAFYVPGRIEVLGKHTDYAGGRSMVAAAERGFCLLARPRSDQLVTVLNARAGDQIRFALNPPPEPTPGHWSNYPMTIVRRVAENFPGANRGLDIVLASDLPSAAGLSSSSALIIAVFLALADANQLADRADYRNHVRSNIDLAGYLGTVENGQSFGTLEGDRGVGTFGGSEDHIAILCSEVGHVGQYAYCPARFERSIAVPSGYRFAIGSSGVVAEKTGEAREKYNRASRLASAIARLWRETTGRDDPHLAAVLVGSLDRRDERGVSCTVDRLRKIATESSLCEFDPRALSARLEHFILESEGIIPAAGDALAAGDLAEFGRLVDASQQGAERLLGNQVPQTIHLAASARKHGAAAASAFGAGFGGSVWAMIEADRAESFLADWSQDYGKNLAANAERSEFFLTGAGPAAFRVC